MIKIGVFGITGETIPLLEKIRKEKGYRLAGHHAPDGGGRLPEPVAEDPQTLIRQADVVLFSAPAPADLPLLREAMRWSRPLFLVDTSHLDTAHLQEVALLAAEADVAVHCFNPLRDHPLTARAVKVTGRVLFAETVRLFPAGEKGRQELIASLLHSLEMMLHLNPTRPRRPVVGTYLLPDRKEGRVQIQMEFDDGMTAVIRHETGERLQILCRLAGYGEAVSVDLRRHVLERSGENDRVRERLSLMPGRTAALWQAWQHFLGHPSPDGYDALTQRIEALHLFRETLDRITIRTYSPQIG